MTTDNEKKSFSGIINSDQTVLVDFSAEWCRPMQNDAADFERTKINDG